MNNKNCIFGLHAVQALLTEHPDRVLRVLVLKDRQDQKMQSIIDLTDELDIKLEFVPRHELDKLSDKANHQGVIAFCRQMKNYTEADLPDILAAIQGPPLLLILDGVQDPHNLGACLRSADAAGVHAVIAPKDKCVGLTPTVCKVACGAAETVPFIQVTNLARTLRFLKDYPIWIFGAAGDADKSVYQADLKVPAAIVLGAEGSGLRRLTREHCDMLLNIPMQGAVSSLNVSVATGIFLFEAVRQRC